MCRANAGTIIYIITVSIRTLCWKEEKKVLINSSQHLDFSLFDWHSKKHSSTLSHTLHLTMPSMTRHNGINHSMTHSIHLSLHTSHPVPKVMAILHPYWLFLRLLRNETVTRSGFLSNSLRWYLYFVEGETELRLSIITLFSWRSSSKC